VPREARVEVERGSPLEARGAGARDAAHGGSEGVCVEEIVLSKAVDALGELGALRERLQVRFECRSRDDPVVIGVDLSEELRDDFRLLLVLVER
jgi:hypothetical protein